MSELSKICSLFKDGKAQSRKKASESLRQLLSNGGVLRRLDGINDRNSCNWSDIFECTTTSLMDELKSSKATSSKKPEMYAAVKCVLHAAKGRTNPDGGPVIPVSSLFDHISVITQEYPELLAEYCHLFVSYFCHKDLWVRWSEPDIQGLSRLLRRMAKSLFTNDNRMRLLHISQAIYSLVRVLCDRIDFRPMVYIHMITQYISQASEDHKVLDNLLKSVNLLMESSAISCKRQILKVSSALSSTLIKLWQSKSNESIKPELIKFFTLFIILQEDKSSDGASEREEIRAFRNELFGVLCKEIEFCRVPLRMEGNKVPALWTEEFFYLLSRLCVLILHDGCELSHDQNNGLPAAKKRRPESVWCKIVSSIVSSMENISQVAWLRLACCMADLIPDADVTDVQLLDLFLSLRDLLSTTKRGVILKELAVCFTKLASMDRCFGASFLEPWKTVCTYAISLIERHHTEFYSLFIELIRHNRSIEKSHLQSLARFSVLEDLYCLCWILHRYQLPLFSLLSTDQLQLMQLKSSTFGLSSEEFWQHIWLADQLMEIPVWDDDRFCVIASLRHSSAGMVGAVLAALVCRAPEEPKVKEQPFTTYEKIFNDLNGLRYYKMESNSLSKSLNMSAKPSFLKNILSHVDKVLEERVTFMCKRLTAQDSAAHCLEDSLWMIEVVVGYMDLTSSSTDRPLCESVKRLWTETLAKTEKMLDKREFSGVPSLISLFSNADNSGFIKYLPNLESLSKSLQTALLISLRSKTLQANAASITDSFDDLSPESSSLELTASASQESMSYESLSGAPSLSAEEVTTMQLLSCLVCLGSCQHTIRNSIFDVLAKLDLSSNVSHSYIMSEILKCAVRHWLGISYTALATLIYYLRSVVECSHMDPQIGVTCLEVISSMLDYLSSCPLWSDKEKETIGSKLVSILHGFSTFLFVRREEPAVDDYELIPQFGINYRAAFARCLVKLHAVDSDGMWIRASFLETKSQLDTETHLIKLLLDRHYSIRQIVVDNINVLFHKQKAKVSYELPVTKQEEVFKRIYEEIRSILAIEAGEDEEFQLDEKDTRTYTLLTLFQRIMITSPACFSKALCALFLFINEENQHITPDIIRQVIEPAAIILEYKSVEDLCVSKLACLAKEWISMEYKLSHFPFRLFGEASIGDFFRRYASEFLPFAVSAPDEVLLELSQLCGMELYALCLNNLPRIIATILPQMATGSDSLKQHATKSFNKCSVLLKANRQQMWSLVEANLGQVLLELHKTMWDRSPSHTSEPQPNPPCYSSEQLLKTKDFMLASFSKGPMYSNLLSIVAQDLTSLTSAILKLAVYMTSCKRSYEVRARVTAYVSFIEEYVIPALTSTLSHCLEFVVETLCAVFMKTMRWLLHLYKKDMMEPSVAYVTAVISRLALHQRAFLSSVSPGLCHVIAHAVPQLTYTLCEVAQSVTPSSEECMTLLKCIWAEQTYHDLLDDMPPLPDSLWDVLHLKRVSPTLHKLIKLYLDLPPTAMLGKSQLLSAICAKLKQTSAEEISAHNQEEEGIFRLNMCLLRDIKFCSTDQKTDILECLSLINCLRVSSGHIISESAHTSGVLEKVTASDVQDAFLLVHEVFLIYLNESHEAMMVCDKVLLKLLSTRTGQSLLKFLAEFTDSKAKRLQAFISPYTASKKILAVSQRPADVIFSDSYWDITQYEDYGSWIRNLVSDMALTCNTDFHRHLQELCVLQTSFCEKCLPVFMYDLLQSGDTSLRSRMSEVIRRHLLFALKQAQPVSSIVADSVKVLILAIQYLRGKPNKHFTTERAKVYTCWHDNFWLDIDFSYLAEAAVLCKEFPMAALFAEIRIIQCRDPAFSPFDAQQIMMRVYDSLNLTDMLYGWGAGKLTDPQSRLMHYRHEGNWSRYLTVNEWSTTEQSCSEFSENFSLLRSGGLGPVLNAFLDRLGDPDDDSIKHIRYKQAWSNMDWSKLPTAIRFSHELSQPESLFMCTKLLVSEEYGQAEEVIYSMLSDCGKTFSSKDLSPSQTREMQDYLSKIAQLNLVLSALAGQRRIEDVVENLSLRMRSLSEDILNQSELCSIEDQLFISSLLLRKHADNQALQNLITDTVIAISATGRRSKLVQVSETIMAKYKALHPSQWRTKCELEQAQIFWAFDEQERALHIIKLCMDTLSAQVKLSVDDARLHSRALRLCGQWLSAMRSDGCDIIKENYLQPAVRLAESSACATEIEHSYHVMAVFCDEEYERLKAYMQSSEYQEKCSVLRTQQAQENDLADQKSVYSMRLKTYRAMNEKELEAVRSAYILNMKEALVYYSKTLLSNSSHDLVSIFRFVAIWFENESFNEIQQSVEEYIRKGIASHKFLPLVYQLAARLSCESTSLQKSLTLLLSRAGVEHPHHVLPVLVALKSAATDVVKGPVSLDVKSRADAASKIITHITQSKKKLVSEYIRLSTALIELANTPLAKASRELGLDSSSKLTQVKDLTHTPVLSLHIKPDLNGDYSKLPTVYKYEPKCENAGGVNQPKVIWCVGSDGKTYKQLCKGKDDTRQDAVMQQVFSLVNQLLGSDSNSKHLAIRTYKVVPLSQRSGLLEWCQGTQPLGGWLANTHGDFKLSAHYRYHPQGYTLDQCRKTLTDVKPESPAREFHKAYMKICSNFPPVMKFFFFEKFLEPSMWLKARTSYTKTAAVTSIVGYVLGIGDRHTNNILIDNNTGELIHIDFGVAFEIGKSLRIPETIPFRLTRDVVDGFGATGVDGLFRRSCEKTLEVLRNSKSIILTILQVLIDDPLLDWTLSEDKLAKLQADPMRHEQTCPESLASNAGTQMSSTSGDVTVRGFGNKDMRKHQQAQSVLLKVHHKLQGFEDNHYLSVSGHINLLIQQAMDPCRLCKLFVGWQPYI